MSLPYEPTAPVAVSRTSFADRLGARTRIRPEPRLGISLAGVGVLLAVVGVVIWAGDYLSRGITVNLSGGAGVSASHRFLGVGLSLFVIVVGYLLTLIQRGPLCTAGVVASALGVPVLVGFATFNVRSSGLPLSVDAIVLVSVAAWLVFYLLLPGSRGHAVYVGLAAIAFWFYILYKASPGALSATPVVNRVTPAPFGSGGATDYATIAALSIAFGVSYYLIGFLLDRLGRSGAATPLALAGFPATAVGIGAAARSLHQLGTGVLLIGVGLLFASYGARHHRRFTTWIWSAGIALGVILIVAKLVKNNNAVAGISFIACGIALVASGQILAVAFGERSDTP